MALRMCRECGNPVSSRAATCAQCGAPVKRKTSPLVGLLAFVMFVVLCVFCAGVFTEGYEPSDRGSRNPTGKADTEKASSQPAAEIEGTASDDLQERRILLIQELQRQGIIQKIKTSGSAPSVYVLSGFFALTFDDKQEYMGVCCAYAYKLPQGDLGNFNKPLLIYDAMTNKSLGYMSPKYGLDLD